MTGLDGLRLERTDLDARPLRGSRFALRQPDACGAGAFSSRSWSVAAAEISRLSGFASPQCFSRFFKNRIGVPPEEFREQDA